MLRRTQVASWACASAFVLGCSSSASTPPAAPGGGGGSAASSGTAGVAGTSPITTAGAQAQTGAAGAAASSGGTAGRRGSGTGSAGPGSAGRSAAGAPGSAAGASAAGSGSPAAGSGSPAAAGGGGSTGTATTPYKGVANSPCAARKLLDVSWYYNWMQTENEPCSDGLGGKFVPMIWGHAGAERQASSIQSSLTMFASRGYGYVLGFNEPDNSSQSNIPVAEAIQLWPSFDNPALRIGSPGTAANANPGQAWFKDFMTQLNANPSLRADFLAIHWYGWNAGSCDAKASQLESYLKWAEAFPGDRPIWITEWGCLNQSAPDEATVIAFYKAAVAMFAKHPRVERYAWYPWSTNCNLNNKDGSLTELGKAYAAAPAMR